jgi:hypothetical protein
MYFDGELNSKLILIRWNSKDYYSLPALGLPKKADLPKQKKLRFRIPSLRSQFQIGIGNYEEE